MKSYLLDIMAAMGQSRITQAVLDNARERLANWDHEHRGITHTNGVLECYECRMLIMSKEIYEQVYKDAPAYVGRIIIKN